MDIVDFLCARLDEDEAIARTASPGPWTTNAESDEVLAVDGITVADGFALSGNQLRATTEHIARHDPARVLADVEAKRRIVQALESAEVSLRNTEPGKEPHELMTGAANSLRAAVRMLAAVYADHRDYREEWRP